MSAIEDLLKEQNETNVYLDLMVDQVDIQQQIFDKLNGINLGTIESSPVESQIVPIQEAPKSIIETANESENEMQSFDESNEYLKSIDSGISDLKTQLEIANEPEDKGGVSTVSTDTKPKKGLLDGLMGMLGIGSLAKMMPKGGLLGGVFGKIGKMLVKPKMIAKFAGKGVTGLAKNALKMLGPITAIGVGMYEFTKGLQDAENIVGKTNEEMSDLELAGAGLAGVISGITFGLVDAKTAFKGLSAIGSTVEGWSKDVYNMLPDAGKGMVDSISNFFFDKKDGLLGGMGDILMAPIKSLRDGNYVQAIMEIVLMPFKEMYSLGKRLGSKIIDGIGAILDFDWSSLLSMEGITSLLSGVGAKIASGLSTAFDVISSGMSSLGSTLWEALGPEIQTDITTVIDTVKGFIKQITDPIINMFTSIVDFATSIPEMIKGALSSVTKSLPFGLGDSLSGLFDDKPTEKTKNTNKDEDNGFFSSLFPKDNSSKKQVSSISKFPKDNSSKKQVSSISNVVPLKQYSSDEYNKLSSLNGKKSSYVTSEIKQVKQNVEGKRATEYSKQRLDKTSQKQQPIIVNNNTTQSSKQSSPIPRRGSVDDLSIGLMNAGALDG